MWHNVTGTTQDKASSLDLLRYWCRSVRDIRYEILEREVFDGGALQRHVIRGDAKGTALEAQICIVFHVDGDRITRIYEYLDPRSVAAVFGDPA